MIAEAILCLALNVYYEARGESYLGQKAVAHVTINRTKDDNYPDNICEVVYQPQQFSWTKKYQPRPKGKAWEQAVFTAERAYVGVTKDPTGGATHFHATEVRPNWSANLKKVRVINNHVFYKKSPKGIKK